MDGTEARGKDISVTLIALSRFTADVSINARLGGQPNKPFRDQVIVLAYVIATNTEVGGRHAASKGTTPQWSTATKRTDGRVGYAGETRVAAHRLI